MQSGLAPRAWLPPLGLMKSLEVSPQCSLAGTWGRPDTATLTPGGAVFLSACWVNVGVRVLNMARSPDGLQPGGLSDFPGRPRPVGGDASALLGASRAEPDCLDLGLQ